MTDLDRLHKTALGEIKGRGSGRTHLACENCWSSHPCHKVGGLEGKIEPLREFEGGPDVLWYITRGHVDKLQFQAEMFAGHGLKISLDEIEYRYARYIPAGKGMKGVTCIHLSKQGRGAFPITMLNAWSRQVRCSGKRAE